MRTCLLEKYPKQHKLMNSTVPFIHSQDVWGIKKMQNLSMIALILEINLDKIKLPK